MHQTAVRPHVNRVRVVGNRRPDALGNLGGQDPFDAQLLAAPQQAVGVGIFRHEFEPRQLPVAAVADKDGRPRHEYRRGLDV